MTEEETFKVSFDIEFDEFAQACARMFIGHELIMRDIFAKENDNFLFQNKKALKHDA